MARLLYFGPSGIGDWCFIYPSFQRLLKAYGITHTTVVLAYRNPGNALLAENLLIQEIVYLDRETGFSRIPAYGLRWLEKSLQLRAGHFDVAAVSYLSNQPDFLLAAIVSGAPVRIGRRMKPSLLQKLTINRPIKLCGEQGKVEIHRLFIPEDFRSIEIEDPVPLLNPRLFEGSKEFVSSIGLRIGKYIVLGIGGGRNAWWKFWPAGHYRTLINAFPEWSFVLLGGGEDDLRQAAAIEPFPANAVNLVNKCKMADALKILINSRAVVGNDSGIANMACTIGIPTVCIYGPTDPEANGPALIGACPVSADVSCSPCFLDDQDPQRVMACRNRKCLEMVSPDNVRGCLERFLE